MLLPIKAFCASFPHSTGMGCIFQGKYNQISIRLGWDKCAGHDGLVFVMIWLRKGANMTNNHK